MSDLCAHMISLGAVVHADFTQLEEAFRALFFHGQSKDSLQSHTVRHNHEMAVFQIASLPARFHVGSSLSLPRQEVAQFLFDELAGNPRRVDKHEAAVRALLDHCLEKGSKDNMSVVLVVLQWEEDGLEGAVVAAASPGAAPAEIPPAAAAAAATVTGGAGAAADAGVGAASGAAATEAAAAATATQQGSAPGDGQGQTT